MKKLYILLLVVVGVPMARAERLEDPATECAKQPASKMMLLVDTYGTTCPALSYFKQSMRPSEAYFTWCTRVVSEMNRLQTQKSSMMEEIYEKKRSLLVQQKMHLNSLVNSIAGEVDRICADESGAKSASGK